MRLHEWLYFRAAKFIGSHGLYKYPHKSRPIPPARITARVCDWRTPPQASQNFANAGLEWGLKQNRTGRIDSLDPLGPHPHCETRISEHEKNSRP